MFFLPMDTEYVVESVNSTLEDIMKTFCPARNATKYLKMILAKLPSLKLTAHPQKNGCLEYFLLSYWGPRPFFSRAILLLVSKKATSQSLNRGGVNSGGMMTWHRGPPRAPP